MLHLRGFVIPLLAAVIVGILVWAYLDRRLRNTVVFVERQFAGAAVLFFIRPSDDKGP
jgi:hypothetical protein